MNKDTRIKLNDTMFDVFHKMSEGNPGALTAMMEMHQSAEKIDPDAFMGAFSPILSLDTLGILKPSNLLLRKVWIKILNGN